MSVRTTGMIVCAIMFAAVGAIYFTHRPQPVAATVTKPVKAAEPPTLLTFSGTIRAQHTVPVGVMVNGQIESFMVDAGQDVVEGQLLARIGNPRLDAAQENARRSLDAAQNKVNSLESEIVTARLEVSRAQMDAARVKDQLERGAKTYQHQQTLNAQGATPRLAFEKAMHDYESSQEEAKNLNELTRQRQRHVETATQELDASKRDLSEKQQESQGAQSGLAAADVHAPVSGLVIARKGAVGRKITPDEGKDLFQIAVNLSMLEAVFTVDGQTAARLLPGQSARVSVPEMQIDSVPATLRELKARQGIAEFLSPTPALRPGTNCSVRVQLK